MSGSRKVANFDSATGMVKALANALEGKGFPGAGQGALVRLLAPLIGKTPLVARKEIYAIGGWMEAVPRRQIPRIRAEDLLQWIVGHYPKRRYPYIFIGSSNGAMIQLCRALGAAWLPQTLLVPVLQSGVPPDDPEQDMTRALDTGRALLERNPELQLHHMHDPNQDRRMLAWMTCFRVKWRRLTETYVRFIDEHLAPGGAIVVVECNSRWPVTELGDRHYFQFGAEGGLEQREYFEGSDRVTDYLARHGVDKQSWSPPAPTTTVPEAEWGFEPSLLPDIEDYASRRGRHLVRLAFDDPQHLSPAVAEFHRFWYRQRGIDAERLLVDCFLLTDPYLTQRTGSVPYWLVFPTAPAAASLGEYLERTQPYREILLGLFSHGTESAGLATLDSWREILSRARKAGRFIGMKPERFPMDFGVFARFHRELRRLPQRYPMDATASLDDFLSFADQMPTTTRTGEPAADISGIKTGTTPPERLLVAAP